MCVTVLQWSGICFERADKPALTPGDAVSCFCVPFSFFVWSLLFLTIFFLLVIFSLCWSCWSCTWINIYFKLKSAEFWWFLGVAHTTDVIQKIEKTLKNTHTTTQKLTNNSFRNTKKHPEFYCGKGISKALDLHAGQAYDQRKTIRHVPPLKQLNFFNVSWHHDKQHTVHHKLY